MAKYRLLRPHTIGNTRYEAGTVIGGDTGIEFHAEPSPWMAAMDEEGRDQLNNVFRRLYGRDAPPEQVIMDGEEAPANASQATGPSTLPPPIQDKNDDRVGVRTAAPLKNQLPSQGVGDDKEKDKK